MRNLISSLAVVVALAASPAFATGERIIVGSGSEAAEQLKQTLCIAMECVTSRDGIEASVSVRPGRNEVEVKVLGADGAVRLTQRVPALADGRMSATDLVSATTKVFQAIESPQLVAEQNVPRSEYHWPYT